MVIKTHLDTYNTDIAGDMQMNTYVDNNLISSTSSEEKLASYYIEANANMENGGFKLCEWTTNSPTLKEKATNDKIACSSETVSVLGLLWDTKSDVMKFKPCSYLTTMETPTKREVLSQISSLYDPLGLLAPVHVKAKIFMQELWKANLGRDDPIPDPLLQVWDGIKGELDNLADIEIP